MNANYIEFYFDCSSPWTYLAFTEMLSLSKRHSIKIHWIPILVGGVFNSVNKEVYEFRNKPNLLKLNYSNDDLLLWSRIREIKINFPKVFPVNSVKAMRGCLFAKKENKLVQFANNVFKSYWVDGIDISREELLLKIAKETKFNIKGFKEFINSEGSKNHLRKNTDELIRRGGFGSPTFFYNDHMFFGNDRLSLFEESYCKGFLDK